MPGLTDEKAQRIIRRGLRERGWTREAIEDCISALDQLFGPWTYATVKTVQDLHEIFQEMEAEFGEAPDED